MSTSSCSTVNRCASSFARSSTSPTSRSSRSASAAITVERGRPHLVVGDDALAQRLDVAADRGQRRAQLVRDRHQEVALELLGLAEPRGHLAEPLGEQADLAGAAARHLDVVVAVRDLVRGRESCSTGVVIRRESTRRTPPPRARRRRTRAAAARSARASAGSAPSPASRRRSSPKTVRCRPAAAAPPPAAAAGVPGGRKVEVERVLALRIARWSTTFFGSARERGPLPREEIERRGRRSCRRSRARAAWAESSFAPGLLPVELRQPVRLAADLVVGLRGAPGSARTSGTAAARSPPRRGPRRPTPSRKSAGSWKRSDRSIAASGA